MAGAPLGILLLRAEAGDPRRLLPRATDRRPVIGRCALPCPAPAQAPAPTWSRAFSSVMLVLYAQLAAVLWNSTCSALELWLSAKSCAPASSGEKLPGCNPGSSAGAGDGTSSRSSDSHSSEKGDSGPCPRWPDAAPIARYARGAALSLLQLRDRPADYKTQHRRLPTHPHLPAPPRFLLGSKVPGDAGPAERGGGEIPSPPWAGEPGRRGRGAAWVERWGKVGRLQKKLERGPCPLQTHCCRRPAVPSGCHHVVLGRRAQRSLTSQGFQA